MQNYHLLKHANQQKLLTKAIQQHDIYEAQIIIKQNVQDVELLNDSFLFSCNYKNVENVKNVDMLDMLQMLLKEGADINYTDYSYETPLLRAIINRNITIVTFLLKNDANPNQPSSIINKYSPLQLAVSNKLHGIARLLLKYGALPNYADSFNTSSLFIAIDRHDTIMIDLLIEFNVNLNKLYSDNKTALVHSCSLGYIDIVRRLIKQKVDLNRMTNDNCALFIAAKQDNQIILQELIDNNVNVNIVNSQKQNVLYLTKNVKNIELLIANKVNINCQDFSNMTPILHHVANSKDNFLLITTLINAGADLTLTNINKQTVYMLAIFNTLEKLLIFLLNNKNNKPIDYFAQDFQNKTLYDYAIDNALLFNNLECLTILKENEIFKCNDLIYAICIRNHTYVNSYLDNKDTDINGQDCLNNTALHYALRCSKTSNDNIIINKLLNDSRLNIYATNNRNESIMHCETKLVQRRVRLEITYNYNNASCKILSKYLIKDIIDNIIYKYITENDIDKIFNKKK
jgi:ankyrin repeat protein